MEEEISVKLYAFFSDLILRNVYWGAAVQFPGALLLERLINLSSRLSILDPLGQAITHFS